MTDITARDVLAKGRELIANPENWTTELYARDADGHGVVAEDPEAVCFCSIGALYRAMSDLSEDKSIDFELLYEVETALRQQIPRQHIDSVIKFNDEHTHADVLALWDKAITAAS